MRPPWGRIRRSIEAARAQLLTQEENQRAVIIGLVGNVAEAYFDLRARGLQVDITKRALKSWEDSVRISRLRFEHGDISKLDLNRFDAERAGVAARARRSPVETHRMASLRRLPYKSESRETTVLA